MYCDEWKDHKAFIEYRKKRMINFMKSQYNLPLLDIIGTTVGNTYLT